MDTHTLHRTGTYVSVPVRIVITIILFLGVLEFHGFWSWRVDGAWSIPWSACIVGSLLLGYDVSYLAGFRGYKRYAASFYCWFVYLWMLWGWQENEPGTSGWWFDSAGHMLFPAITAQFILIRLSVRDPYRWRKERFEVEEKTFLYVLCLGVVWEIVEMFIDGLQSFLGWWEVILQKGDTDTVSDIALAIPFAILSIWLRRMYEQKAEKINPAGMEEVDAEMLMLEEFMEQRDMVDNDIARHVTRIRLLQKQNLVIFTRRPISERFARVLRRRRRKRKNIQTAP